VAGKGGAREGAGNERGLKKSRTQTLVLVPFSQKGDPAGPGTLRRSIIKRGRKALLPRQKTPNLSFIV